MITLMVFSKTQNSTSLPCYYSWVHSDLEWYYLLDPHLLAEKNCSIIYY